MPDDYTEEEIEQEVEEVALEHFGWSYKILPVKSNPGQKTFKDLIDSWRKDIKLKGDKIYEKIQNTRDWGQCNFKK